MTKKRATQNSTPPKIFQTKKERFSKIMSNFWFGVKFLFVLLFVFIALFVLYSSIVKYYSLDNDKILAQNYGCFAEFRSYNFMLLIAVFMSFFGFIFAAPGAVIISGPIGKRRNGKISRWVPYTGYD